MNKETVSIGHRAVESATAAGFLARLKDLIEEQPGIVARGQVGIFLAVKLLKLAS